MQSFNKQTPAMMSNGGASRCQLITAPGGYSSTSSSAIEDSSIPMWDVTFFIRLLNFQVFFTFIYIVSLSKIHYKKDLAYFN